MVHLNVVVDTNVFVAAGFSRDSHSAQILTQIRQGNLSMIWHPQTREETEYILRKIPPLSWEPIADLFQPESCYVQALDSQRFRQIPDEADRKFVALSVATGATLLTLDRGILNNRDHVTSAILRPDEFLQIHPLVPLDGGI